MVEIGKQESIRNIIYNDYKEKMQHFIKQKKSCIQNCCKMNVDINKYAFNPPLKDKELMDEEIFVTILGILKKQQKEIDNLKADNILLKSFKNI